MGYQLVVTEKPSVAKALSKVLGANRQENGHLSGNGYYVTWCLGHLVELADTSVYDIRYRSWNYCDLPIIPETWKYSVKNDVKPQFEIVKRLMLSGEVDEICCATDAGREGELIFRLVYEQAGCREPFRRLWISSMEEGAILEGFRNLKPGNDYDNLYQSALCRQRADWLVGINGTRLFSVIYDEKLKVGRVQTPTLAMIVDREKQIMDFRKTPFYTVHLISGGIDAVSDKFKDKQTAIDTIANCVGLTPRVESVAFEDKRVSPPKLYDLTSLQRDANKIFAFTAKQTLDHTQSLYEKKLCTYPRTDSQYLTDDMEDTARKVLGIVVETFSFLKTMADRKSDVDSEMEDPKNNDEGSSPADISQADYRRILDSSKVSDHHAIIPTAEISRLDKVTLNDGERKILSLIALRLAEAVSQEHRYRSGKATIRCGDTVFTATGKTVLKEGWKRYMPLFRQSFRVKAEENKADDDKEKTLPVLMQGDTISEVEFKMAEGSTQPPKRFTEDSLLNAMEHAGEEETTDKAERKGLGTPATRADIIEKLVKDGFVERNKKQLIPTESGKRLISILPENVKSAKLTSDWENALTMISKGKQKPDAFMNGIIIMVKELVMAYSKAGEEKKMTVLGKCTKCGGDVVTGKFGPYCKNKCGMFYGKAFGKALTDEQVKDLLEGRKIFVEGLTSKNGSTYDAYLTPKGTKDFNYRKKDGTEGSGTDYDYLMEYPEKEEKQA